MTLAVSKFVQMIDILKEINSSSKTKLAKKLNADIRTVKPLIEAGIKLHVLDVQEITLSGRIYTKVSLSSEYKFLLNHILSEVKT